jgi:6-pyruvoyl-tetrahydropterin synthase
MKNKSKNVPMEFKKIIFFSCFLLIINSLNAQLKVETNGRVKFGPGSLRVFSGTDDWGYINVGNTTTKGLRFTPTGKMYLYNSDPTSFVTVTSTTTQRNLIVMDPTGNYKFWVLGDGSIFSQSSYITSDSSKKENVALIPNALEKVMKIKGITYDFKDVKLNEKSKLGEKIDDSIKVSLTSKTKERSAGVFAQDVEKVLPEAVRTLEDGSKVVSYDNLVALLIEAIKEQQVQIDALKSKAGTKLKSADENILIVESLSGASLGKNKPNPFNQETTIGYYLPAEVNSATLYIYDLQGKQIKSINITERGQSSTIIYANELQAGMYKYVLIADGQVVGNETMILTN